MLTFETFKKRLTKVNSPDWLSVAIDANNVRQLYIIVNGGMGNTISTPIERRCGYGAIHGDGKQLSIDLCQHCFAGMCGDTLRVTDPLDNQSTDSSEETIEKAWAKYPELSLTQLLVNVIYRVTYFFSERLKMVN
jgi:hypothetical protein